MNDLIERLRYPAFEHAGTAVMEEAADHIEALEAALRKIANMDPRSIRADDLGRAARIAHTALVPEREYDPNVEPCDDAEFGMKP